jgi:PKD repeat protein
LKSKRTTVRWLSTAAVTILAAAALASPLRAQGNPVVIENLQTGSSEWLLGDLYGRPYATDQAGQIKGYASATSVNKGESITFHVSVTPAQTYTIDVYRIGWYQGLGGRLMQRVGPLSGLEQPTCPTDPSTGMIECNWTPSHTLDTQGSWTSGIYLAVLGNAGGFYNYIVFAVRDDSRVGALLYQQPVTTYQAYNNYPQGAGKSLYEHNSAGANTLTGTTRAVKVSFDRPYSTRGAGQLLEVSEINFLRWAERSGYDITYSTDVDTHRNGALLSNHRGFLSLPHDEYWSKPMYDAAFAARAAAVNLAFFGANSIYWQVRLEASSSGVGDRVIVCYKDLSLDPVSDPDLKTIKWRDAPVSRPEQALMGVQFTDGPSSGQAAHVVTNSGNWVYAGTGFRDGDSVPGIVWYEADRLVAADPPPVAINGTYTLLSHSPYAGSGGNPDYSNSSIYHALSGAWVFASGTMGWGWGLDNFYPEGRVGTVDVRIQQTTANILNRFLGINLPPTVAASATPAEGPAPFTVTFSSTGSADPEGQSVSYLWNFGDGAVSTAANPVHVFSQDGQYTASLTVSDGEAATSSGPLLITVGPELPQPLTVAQSKGAFGDASATTLMVQLTNVKAGSLIVAYVKWEGPAASTVALNDGLSTFVADTLNSAANDDLHGRFFYLLSSSMSGTVNYTATWSASTPYRKLMIYEYSYSGSVSLDASSRATATSGDLTTGEITTTGSDEIVFGAYGEYNANTTTDERINGVAADQVVRAG